MAQTSWPFENIDTTETEFSQWARNIGEGVKGSLAGTELKPFGDSSGLNAKVPAGQSMVRGHYYVSTATETLTITTPHATNPRIDLVVLELEPTANSILLKVIAGTAAVSPVPPTLTQTDAGTYQQLLAQVAVPAAATIITAGNVTDARTILNSSAVAWSDITGKPTSYSSAIITTAVSDKSASYTLTSSDKNTFIRSTGSAITITVPDCLANGESVNFVQGGAGQITFAGSNISISSVDAKLLTAKQFAGVTITKLGGVYYLIGNLG